MIQIFHQMFAISTTGMYCNDFAMFSSQKASIAFNNNSRNSVIMHFYLRPKFKFSKLTEPVPRLLNVSMRMVRTWRKRERGETEKESKRERER